MEIFFSKFPNESSILRLKHNHTIREWSYKGVTSSGIGGRKLKSLSRSSRDAGMLPPLFRRAPDFGGHSAHLPRRRANDDVRQLIEVLGNAMQPIVGRGGRGSMIARRISHIGSPSVDRSIVGAASLVVEATDVVDDDEDLVLRQDTGILFCREILKVSNGIAGLRGTFEKIDKDGNGRISMIELSEFLIKIGLRLDISELKAVHKYLSGDDDIVEGRERFCVTALCGPRVIDLIKRYENSRKAIFLSSNSEYQSIPESHRYFQQFSWNLEPLHKL